MRYGNGLTPIISDSATKLQFYSRTGDAWEAMYCDCLKAKASIEFEEYIMRNDEIGRRFLSLFIVKAKEGVAVHLLLDQIGSRSLIFSPQIKQIREHGGTITFYNPIPWIHVFMPSTWFPRNHTKTMLIDSRIAYIGSVCLADYMRDWRDLYARVTGDLVDSIVQDFAYIWAQAIGVDKIPLRPTASKSAFHYVVAKARLTPSPVYKELLLEIAQAEKNIYLATPYFMPPLRLRHALLKAIKRGVKVKVMVTERSDVPLANLISRSYFPRFIRAGISILSYNKSVFHAKYTVIDDSWATMGSTNIDYLSLLRNREANILIRDPATIAALKHAFIADMVHCIILSPDVWKDTPLLSRVVGYLGRAIKRMI